MNRAPLLLVAISCVLVACHPSDKAAASRTDSVVASDPAVPAGGARSADKDLSDIQNYHLTMDNVNKWFTAQRNVALKVRGMSAAERASLDQGGSGNGSMDALVARLEGNTSMNSAIHDAGLSARDYALLTMAMVQSTMAAGVLKMRPKDNQDSLVHAMKANMENVRFMQEHEAELARKQQEMEAEMKRMGVTDAQ
jgi:hypothetical protein